MAPLPDRQPKQLSLGPLEREILEIVWELGTVTVKDIHDRILSDPERELAYASVATILNRLTHKGWLTCNKQERSHVWEAVVSSSEAQALQAYSHLKQFLAIGSPDIVAAFAGDLDRTSMEQLAAISQKLQAIRQSQENQ